MTIIAYKDGVLASDSACFGGSLISGDMTKVFKTKHGDLFGCCGAVAAGERFRSLYSEHGPDLEKIEILKDEGFGAIVIDASGENIVIWTTNGVPIRGIRSPIHAMGAAEEMAIGAMAAGASAIEAVEICIKHHSGCAGEVQSVRLDEKTKLRAVA